MNWSVYFAESFLLPGWTLDIVWAGLWAFLSLCRILYIVGAVHCTVAFANSVLLLEGTADIVLDCELAFGLCRTN